MKKAIFNSNTISVDDLRYLNELLKTGMSINNCFEVLKNKDNETIFNVIKKELDTGKVIDEVLINYLPKKIGDYILPLLKSLSFKDCLDLSINFYDKQKEKEAALLKTALYPFVLLFVSFTALLFFDLFGLDTIFNLLTSFSVNITLYKVMRIIIRVLIIFFYSSLIILSLLGYIFTRNKKVREFYLFICRFFPDGLIKNYYNSQFIEMFLICSNKGYKTKQSLEILRLMHCRPIISFLAFYLDDGLSKGFSIDESSKQYYFDSVLTNFIKIGVASEDFVYILNNYLKLNELKLDNKMKLLANSIQVGTYGFVGLIIIFVYQILFMPMQAIINF